MKMMRKRTTRSLSPRWTRTSGRTSLLVVPDPDKGDRPFDARPYGRVRMNEAMAREAARIFRDEIERLLEVKHSEATGPSVRHSLRNTEKLLQNVVGMMEEKGW
jgi:hypothetical protein